MNAVRAAVYLVIVFSAAASGAAAEPAPTIDFQRDIRPILSENCFECHGPDAEHREADLRLDVEASAKKTAIVSGDTEKSEFLRRITSSDDDERMPPKDSRKTLTAKQIELLRRWIAEGAEYQTHWAFVTPRRPEVPAVENGKWVRNPIDAFVLRRLEQEKLSPSSAADPVTLLRRLSLDLTGLPPSPAEIEQFRSDPSPQAIEAAIDRLLQSSHFGERWARLWLDAARYADSDGYEKDKPRDVWFYRDWVIRAFNRDMPYNDFIIEQIGGDLLPDATQDQVVATGFLRNSMVNEEGGADPEQFRMEGMFDRMDAIGKSILGLTIQCTQCHSHKYDPLTQEEYYRMFAFLNNFHEAIPTVYTREEQKQRREILGGVRRIERELRKSMPDWRERMAAWEAEARETKQNWEVLDPVDRPYEGQKFRVLNDLSIISESYAPTRTSPEFGTRTEATNITGFRLELLTHPQLPRNGPGRSILGTGALTQFDVFVAPADNPGKRTKVKIVSATADVNPPERPVPAFAINIKAKGGDKRVTGPIAYAIDGDGNTAWTTDSDPGRRNQARKAVFVAESPVGFPQGTIVTFRLSMNHGGWNSDDNQNYLLGRYRLSLTTDPKPVADPLPATVRNILDIPPEKRTRRQTAAVFRYWRTTVPEWADENKQIEELWQQHPDGTTQLAVQERAAPRKTYFLERGDFLKRVRQVSPGVPDLLHPLPADAPPTRLTFARWLADERSPTTARSIVNRIWQAYFGTGIVETSDDLGSQGSPPTHPELLDWLSVELMENGWSLKHIHRLIVNSATYRQSSQVSPELQARDPYNQLLARGPRFRVDAELVRDITLEASGLLDPDVGGPSVHPPAPEFLFQPPASYGPKTWKEDTGPERYRRGIYTFRFRSVPYPMLETFDAPVGNASCVRRSRSNTPLQALTSLNEPIYLECARALALRMMQEGGEGDALRITYGFRCCVARDPAAKEMAALQNVLDKQRKRYADGQLNPADLLGTKADVEPGADPAERAAWTIVARVLLNLDETITKE